MVIYIYKHSYNRPFISFQCKLSRLLACQRLRFRRLDRLFANCQECECLHRGQLRPNLLGELGTGLAPLKVGFLWVISLLSTLRRPLVTSSPRFSCSNTAAAPPVPASTGSAGAGGGGGGGGGGGADASVAALDRYTSRVIPYSGISMNKDLNFTNFTKEDIL